MLRYNFLLLFFLAVTGTALDGQNGFGREGKGIDVYPVRVNHKFGFVKFFRVGNQVVTDTMIPPRYDYIGDVNLPWNSTTLEGGKSPYRLFELDNKVGLLDPYLQEALPNHYKRIRPLSHRFFAVEQDTLFQLLDYQTDSILFGGQRFDDICLADTLGNGYAYFFVKQGLFWGIRGENNKQLVNARYLDIQPAGTKGYYKARTTSSDNRWLLIDTLGRKVLKEPYEDVMVLGENLVAFKEKARWQMLGRNPEKGQYEFRAVGSFMEEIEKVDERVMVGVTVKPIEVEVWQIEKQVRIIRFNKVFPVEKHPLPEEERLGRTNRFFPWVFPLDSQHVVVSSEVSRRGYVDRVMDLNGQFVSEAYSAILPSGKAGIFKASRFGSWGLISPERGGILLDFMYRSIADFKGHYASLRNGLTHGLVGMRGNRMDTLECIYDNISILPGSDTLYVQLGAQISVQVFEESGEFTTLGLFDNLAIVPRNTAAIQEAMPIAKEQAAHYQLNTGMEDELIIKEEDGNIYVLKYERAYNDRGRLETREKWSASLPLYSGPPSVQEIIYDELIAFHHAEESVTHSLGDQLYAAKLLNIKFYDVKKGAYLPTPRMFGMRSFQAGSHYTTFIDENGQMGLVNRRGEECEIDDQPLRYTYIGPFVAGRARVCMGGELAVVGREEEALPLPYKFRINSPAFFKGEFNIWLGEGAANQQQATQGHIFALDRPDSPCRWGYIDTSGRLVMEVEADYIEDFYPEDSIAFVLRINKRTDAYGHPDADYGVINYEGKEILPTDYSKITNLKEYLLLTVDSTPTFFFTQRGHEIFVNPTRLRPFSEGLAQFRDASNRWGYVDTAGQVAIPPQYLKSRPFSDGMALVADSTGKCLYIRQDGSLAFRTPFSAKQWRGLGDFHDGRAWFKGKGWSWGAFDQYGQEVIPSQYYYEIGGGMLPQEDEAYPLPIDFSGGVASVVRLTSGAQPMAIIIDTSGQALINRTDLATIGSFGHNGLAVYRKKNGKLRGLIGSDGNIVIEPTYQEIDTFRNGVARVRSSSGQWGLINETGEEVITPAYYRLGLPSEGLVAAKDSRYSDWSYLDHRGRIKIEGPFKRASPFAGGVAFVTSDKKQKIINKVGLEVTTKAGKPSFFSEGIFGIVDEEEGHAYYADATGNNIFGRYYEEISPFQLGVAKVRRLSEREDVRELLGAINRRGVMIVPPKYRMLHIQPDGNIIINPQRYHGLADKQGNVLVEPTHDKIDKFAEPGLYRLERGEKVGYVILDGGGKRVVWELGN